MKKAFLFLGIIFFWFLPSAHAEIKTFVHTVRQPFSGSQSPDDARVAATHKAKREVLEKAGTYLETLSIVEDGRLTKDQILAVASGVLKTEIISQKNYMTGEGFGIVIKARVKVDTSVLEERIRKLMTDRTAMKQLTAVRKREKELLVKIEILEEKQLLVKIERLKEKHSGSGKVRINQIREKQIKKGFREATKGLDAVALNVQVFSLWEDGKYSNPRRAIDLLNKAIELDPGLAGAHYNRGTAYDGLKQHGRAIQDFDKAIELDPDFAMAYSNRGNAYGGLKQYGRAIQDFDKAIELEPDLAMAYSNRGNAYGGLKQYGRAIQDFDKAIELDPGLAVAYNNRGLAYMNLKQFKRAIQNNNKAIELDPDLAVAYNNRGVAFINLKQYARAIQDFDKWPVSELSTPK